MAVAHHKHRVGYVVLQVRAKGSGSQTFDKKDRCFYAIYRGENIAKLPGEELVHLLVGLQEEEGEADEEEKAEEDPPQSRPPLHSFLWPGLEQLLSSRRFHLVKFTLGETLRLWWLVNSSKWFFVFPRTITL